MMMMMMCDMDFRQGFGVFKNLMLNLLLLFFFFSSLDIFNDLIRARFLSFFVGV